MLTVMWTSFVDNGQVTRIYEANDVAVASRYDIGSPRVWEVDGRPVDRCLVILDPSDLRLVGRSFDRGLVEVFNSAGARVARYELMLDPESVSVEPAAVV